VALTAQQRRRRALYMTPQQLTEPTEQAEVGVGRDQRKPLVKISMCYSATFGMLAGCVSRKSCSAHASNRMAAALQLASQHVPLGHVLLVLVIGSSILHFFHTAGSTTRETRATSYTKQPSNY
jgi:hypothetical protein